MSKKTELDKAYKIWNKKLDKSGFVDVERKKKYMRQYTKGADVKTVMDEFSKKETQNPYSLVYQQSKQEFYRLATHFLNDYEFKSERDRIIWTYFQEGLGAVEIHKIFKDLGIPRSSRDTIGRTLSRLTEEMKKMYGVK